MDAPDELLAAAVDITRAASGLAAQRFLEGVPVSAKADDTQVTPLMSRWRSWREADRMGGAKKSAKFHQVLPVALGQANLYVGRFTATDD